MTRIQKTKKLRSVLTKKPNFSIKLFAAMWKNNLTIDELAAFFGVSDETIRIAANNLQFAKKRKIKQELAEEWKIGDPTPEEIKERTAIVRQKWSQAETARRLGARPAKPVNLRHFVYNVRTSSFSAANC
jgi:DNA-directed RNA polymerase sigma subunit (sigma70/sigma32)